MSSEQVKAMGATNILRALRGAVVDWDGSQMKDGEDSRLPIKCRFLRDILAILDGTGDARGTVWHDKWEQAAIGAAKLMDRLKAAEQRVEAAESKLTALLDGIEGLEAIFRKHNESLSADALKALREKAK